MKQKLLFFTILFICLLSSQNSNAQNEPLLGEIKIFAGNFAPRGWALCQGQLLPISQHSALFSILGTIYGGDGRTTFALPDLRGRVPISSGRGSGLSDRRLGARSGQEIVTLNITNLPNHTHNATFTQTSGVSNTPAVADEANTDDPTNNRHAIPNIAGTNRTYSNAVADTNLASGTVTVTGNIQILPTGAQQPFNNMQPYLTINYIIALQGIFPSRN